MGLGYLAKKLEYFVENRLYEKNLISELNDKDKNQFLFYDMQTTEEAIKKDLAGENSVWDAYWYQTIYINGGLTLSPNVSHIQNEGFDGTGLHCKENDLFFTPLSKKEPKFFRRRQKLVRLTRLILIYFF